MPQHPDEHFDSTLFIVVLCIDMPPEKTVDDVTLEGPENHSHYKP